VIKCLLKIKRKADKVENRCCDKKTFANVITWNS